MRPAAYMFRLALVIPALGTLVSAGPASQPQVFLTTGPSYSWATDWTGVTGRTYFMQYSLDLVNWAYLPVIRFGQGPQSKDGIAENASRFFIRLRYVDAGGIANLAEAKAADYDGDGVSNRYEVEVEGSNPLDAASHGGDSDMDGLPDGWEREYFGNLAHNGTMNSDGDGLTDAQEWELGSNPLLTDTDGDGAADGILRQELEYDQIGRLNTANGGAAGAQVFVTDAVGNVEQGDGMAAGLP